MANKRKSKLICALYDLYRDLYKHSTPSASFDELVKNAKVIKEPNGRELKCIDYENYTIDNALYDNIVQRHMSRNKHKLDKQQRDRFYVQAYLGCGPTTTN